MNNTFSEHIGCKIFQLLDIPVQETFLAKYKRSDGKTEIVVACKDFRSSRDLQAKYIFCNFLRTISFTYSYKGYPKEYYKAKY